MVEKEMRKPSLMTVDEVAKYLRMRKVTIYKHSQEGKLPGFKVGSTWRYKKATIDRWIEEQETKNKKK
jgi:excisionase family DNA binding protein